MSATCPTCGHELTRIQQPLTRRQAQVLAFIKFEFARVGYAPTFDEIAARFGYRSLGTVADMLRPLEQKGYIKRTFNAMRGIVLLQEAVAAQRAVGCAWDDEAGKCRRENCRQQKPCELTALALVEAPV